MKHLLLLLLCAFPLACSTGPRVKASEQPVREPPAKTLESQYVAAAESANAVAEVDFTKGSATLSNVQIEKLRKEVAFARKRGAPDRVQVVAWSDSEYPAKDAQPLPPEAATLAQQRAEAVEQTLVGLSEELKGKFKRYLMTARPKGLDSVFHSGEKELKEDFEEAGLNGKDTKTSKFAGKVVVLIQNKAGKAEKPADQSDATPSVKP
jgi:hypothetical protein